MKIGNAPPPKIGRPYHYKFDLLKKVNDFIEYKFDKHKRNLIASAASTYSTNNGVKLTVRREGDKLRVYRIA